MRSFNIEGLLLDAICLKNEPHFHLANVLRAKKGTIVTCFNDESDYRTYEITDIKKRESYLNAIAEKHKYTPDYKFTCLVGVTKKDAIEDSIRVCIESGIGHIVFCRMERSQEKFKYSDRLNKIIINAREQSNFYSPVSISYIDDGLDSFNFEQYSNVVLFSSQDNMSKIKNLDKVETLLVIGPEGGFSENEVVRLRSLKNLVEVNLLGPIRRTPTAISTAIGYLQAKSGN